MTPSRTARLALAVPVALIAAYIAVWAQVSHTGIGRSDFTATYVGGTLYREGHRADLYAESAQAPLHSALIAPDSEGNLPFVDAPVAAVLAAPVSLLPLEAAYRLWGLLQLGLLVAAVAIAVRCAPWPGRTDFIWKVVAALSALAALGMLPLLLQAQWTSVGALGLALAYRDWRRGRHARGGALLVASAALAKPHLALALVAFMLGWRNRAVIAGALAGAAAVAITSLLAVGPAGIAGFVHALSSSSGRWDYASFVSFVGIPGALFGSGFLTAAVGYAGTGLACGAALWLGSRVRANRELLSPALAAAAVLSVLAAPHALPHDLALLAPAAAWTAPTLVTGGVRRLSARTVVATLAVTLVAAAQLLVARGGLPAGAALPALLLLVVVALLVPQTFARAKLAPSGYALLASGGTTPAAGSGGAGPQSPIAGGHAATSV